MAFGKPGWLVTRLFDFFQKLWNIDLLRIK